MSAYPYSHGYPYHGRPYTTNIPPQTYEPYPHYYPNPYEYPPPQYTYPPYPNTSPYSNYAPYPYNTPSVLTHERIEKPTYQNGEESISSIAESINNRLIQVMKEIDPSREPALQATIPSIVKPPSHYNPQSNYNPERNRYSHSYTHPSYSPPPQQHDRYFHETPPFAPKFTKSIPYERPSCEYLPLVNDEIQTLKDKLELFIQMAKEDTIKLRDEIRSEMKKNLVTLRKEELPLDEIEAKMRSMSEELMTRMLPMDPPTIETDQQESDKMNKTINDEEVCVSTELDTPVLQEVSALELNTQQWGEIESEDDDHIEIVWEDEKPTQGKTLTPTLIESSYNVCEGDSLVFHDNFDECDKVSFCSWESDSLQFCDDLGSEDDIELLGIIEVERERRERIVTIDNPKEQEWRENALDVIDCGKTVHWETFKDKFLGDGTYEKKGEEGYTILKYLRVVPHAYLSIECVFPFFAFVFKDVLHLGAFLEEKVHETLGKVPKSVCFEG